MIRFLKPNGIWSLYVVKLYILEKILSKPNFGLNLGYFLKLNQPLCLKPVLYPLFLHLTRFLTHWLLEYSLYLDILVKKCTFNFYKHSVTHNLIGVGAGEDRVGAPRKHPQKVGAEPVIEKKSLTLVFTYSE